MSTLDELIKTTGDESRELLKTDLLQLIKGAKSEAEAVVKETGEKIEKWTKLKLEGELDSDELEALLNSRRRVVRQFLNMQKIEVKARLEKVTLGLIDLILNKALDVIL